MNLAAAFRTAPPTAWFGLGVVTVGAAIALSAPLIAGYGETEIVGSEFAPWDAEHWFGTDNLGRDMLTRLIYGARNTIGIAAATTALAFVGGGSTGLVAGTIGGWVDQLLSRTIDVIMGIPSLILSLLLLTIFGTSVASMVLIIAAIEATRIFRLARALASGISVLEYVQAAQLRGEGLAWLVFREILPNARGPLIAEFGLRFCFVFLFISTLSFLGLGIQPPTADWGSMVRDNASLITFGDVTPLMPAGAIALLTVAVNFIVDWLLHRSSGLKD
ncbi:MAG: ABC transporter permease [Proteobacteria bacterium]|nr:ABC transporter permease [Pseudomonadota bacterium]